MKKTFYALAFLLLAIPAFPQSGLIVEKVVPAYPPEATGDWKFTNASNSVINYVWAQPEDTYGMFWSLPPGQSKFDGDGSQPVRWWTCQQNYTPVDKLTNTAPNYQSEDGNIVCTPSN
jgi:hypothetical protein